MAAVGGSEARLAFSARLLHEVTRSRDERRKRRALGVGDGASDGRRGQADGRRAWAGAAGRARA